MEEPIDEAKLGKTLGFMRHLWALAHALQSRSKRMETAFGITGQQRLALRIIGRVPGLTAGEAAELMRLHPSTFTGIMQRIEARGLIERSRDDADGRRSRLALTERGRALNDLRAGTVEEAIRRALARLEPEEIVVAQRVLDTLSQELERDDG